MIRILMLAALLTGCANSATSKVSQEELNTYRKWACDKCDTLKNATSKKACKVVCKKESAY